MRKGLANMLSQPIFWAKYFEIVLFVCSWGAFLSLSHTREPHSQTRASPVSRAQYKKTLWMETFDKTAWFITSCMCYRLLPRLPLYRIYTHPSKTYLQFLYMKTPYVWILHGWRVYSSSGILPIGFPRTVYWWSPQLVCVCVGKWLTLGDRLDLWDQSALGS